MGLDQYAYVAAKKGQHEEWWEGASLDETKKDFVNPKIPRPREIAYWRKHPNLQGWMEDLWRQKGCESDAPGDSFNGVELELTWEDLVELEQDVLNGYLPSTQGFFFGDDSDDYYKEQDLKFIREAKAELIVGLRVFYNSSW